MMTDSLENVSGIVHHFTWKLLEHMMERFPHIPDFAWIFYALPLKYHD